MNTRTLLRAATTLVLLAASIARVRALWLDYMFSPWTSDGRVRAKVVQIAIDVFGLVSEVRVHDNQYVHKGDVLSVLDPARFQYAIDQADADLQRAPAQLAETKARMAAAQTGVRTLRLKPRFDCDFCNVGLRGVRLPQGWRLF
jgi:multidrug resistance efflux pump